MLIADIRPNGSIYLSVYASADSHVPYTWYSFTSWAHFVAHFGSLLPLLACPIYVHVGGE